MNRREFMKLLGAGSMAWPLTAVAQSRKPATLGILVARNPDPTQLIERIKQGLRESRLRRRNRHRLRIAHRRRECC